jgi:hypothetical protein
MESIVIKVKQVFLSQFDGEAMYEDLKRKVAAGEPLTDEDAMRFIILPLTDKNGSPSRVRETVELAKEVKEERQQLFIIAGLLTATDKFIDREYADKVREWLKMTKVARLYEEEKLEAVIQTRRQVAQNLLEDGADILLIMKATGLTRKEIESIAESSASV